MSAGDERSGKHAECAPLIGAYLDGELAGSGQRRVEAHLAGCARCQHVLQAQIAIRNRLAAPAEPGSEALREQIRQVAYGGPADVPPADAERQRGRSWRRPPSWMGWSGWAAAAVLAALLAASETRTPAIGRDGPEIAVAADTSDVPMIDDALADFRRRMQGEMDLGADIAAVAANTPFPVRPLAGPGVQLLGAWSTEILDRPAAALAYRWRDRVVIQYVVSEALFFAPPEVRASVARAGRYTAAVGRHGVVAWPGAGSGSILVGDAEPAELARLAT